MFLLQVSTAGAHNAGYFMYYGWNNTLGGV
jgi:hypothetical protein